MTFIIRPADIFDVWALQPRMRPADQARYGVQLARSQTFALVDHALFAAGGIYLDAVDQVRICWMLTRERPPARSLLEAVRLILDHAGPGFPIVADIDTRNRADLRFARALGFVSSASPPSPSLPAHIDRMELRA